MKYTVIWLPSAEEELAEAWLRASDRERLTEAAERLDRRLQRFGGSDIGESRPSGRRIIFEPPLGAMFRVNRSERVITVSHIWRFRTS